LVLFIFINNSLAEEIFKNNHNVNGDDSTFKDFLAWRFNGNRPEKFAIEVSNEFNNANNLPDDAYAVWIGHASFLINNNNINILTDPIFSNRASPFSFIGPKRLIPPGININKLPPIDVVTVSHAHYDHLDLPSLKKLYEINKETLFLVPMNLGKLLKSSGVKNVVEMNWWDTITIKDSLITFVPVHHWSSRTTFDKNETLWGGWWFENETNKFLHLGDTGYTYDFDTIYNELGSPDVAFIPIGAYEPRSIMKDSHLNPEESIQAAIDLKTTKAIGMHWGTFMLTDEPVLDPPIRLNKELIRLNLENLFLIPMPGEIISLE
jgi:L-ascorbate metabolism protein UlaG (beta-lactamase superfamily)